MNNRTVTIVIVSTLVLLGIGFSVFYFLVLKDAVPGNSVATSGGKSSNPLFPNTGVSSTSPNDPFSPASRNRNIRDTESDEVKLDAEGNPIITTTTIPPKKYGSIRQLSAKPVGGATAYQVSTSSSPTIRFIEKEKGNILDFRLDKPSAERISIETIPRIQEAFFTSKGAGVAIRYLKNNTIETYGGRLILSRGTTSKGYYELEGSFFPQNITDLSADTNTDHIFYLLTNLNGSSGFISGVSGDKRTEIFTSPASEWLSSFADGKTVILQSKPSQNERGTAYAVDVQGGPSNRIFAGIKGQTLLVSPDKTLYLYSISTGNSVSSRIFDATKLETKDIEIKTLPEKCVWSMKKSAHIIFCGIPTPLPSGIYPDSWYMGITAFTDEIWKYDIDTAVSERIASVNLFPKGPVDVLRPFLTPKEDYFIFMDKNDLSLWSVQVVE